uniref:Uncharacterized protein n=1 Tax=Corvus moneduloides TaxID=1196302 RepID=A0A8C3DRX7_CORMO
MAPPRLGFLLLLAGCFSCSEAQLLDWVWDSTKTTGSPAAAGEGILASEPPTSAAAPAPSPYPGTWGGEVVGSVTTPQRQEAGPAAPVGEGTAAKGTGQWDRNATGLLESTAQPSIAPPHSTSPAPGQQAASSPTEDPQLQGTGATEELQLLGSGTSEDPQLLGTGITEHLQLLRMRTTEDPQFLGSATSKDPQLLHSGTTEDLQVLRMGTTEDPQLLGSGATEDLQLLGLGTTEDPQLLGTSTKDLQLLVTGSTKDSQLLGAWSTEDLQLLGTGTTENLQLLVTPGRAHMLPSPGAALWG